MRPVVVIMAGGAGERFWPVSRPGRPKQFLRLLGERTMLEDAVARISNLIPPDDIHIVLGEDIAEAARRELAAFRHVRIIVEPMRRNTTACLALASARISARVGPHTMAVLTADHLIRPEDRFCEQVAEALRLAKEGTAGFVLMGKRPTRPETGFGYIELDNTSRRLAGGTLHGVKGFREKPDLANATRYTASGRHLWNAGMFFWRSDLFEAALREHCPAIGDRLGELATCEGAALRDVYEALPSLPVDIAVMEKVRGLRVLEMDFEWDDVGSWTALERLTPGIGTIQVGPATVEDCDNTIVYVEPEEGLPSPQVSVLGLKDVVVAVSGGRVLVVAKDRAQDVKKVVPKA